MGPVCPADGVCVRWGWASWPGLQCQDPTLFCPSTSPNSCVLRPSSPSPRSPNGYETGVGGGKTPSASLLPQPLQLHFLISTPEKSVDTADIISDLAKISVRQSWAQAAWLSKVILGAPTALSWRGGGAAGQALGRLHCQLGVAVLLATGSWAEGLALQVNLLTWWLWLAVGGGVPRGALRSSESGHRAAITSRAGQRGRQDGLTERAGLHPQLSSTNRPGGHIFGGGNCPGLPPHHSL